MSARQVYVETSPSGRPQFVSLRRSRSHNHHGHHHFPFGHHHHEHEHRRHRDEYADVTKDEWENLVERERNLREANEALSRDNATLKSTLQSNDAELRRLQAWIPHLEHDLQALRAENQSLRRSLDTASEHSATHHHEAEKLRKKIHKLERENESLMARIRELTRQCRDVVSDRIRELTETVAVWRRRFEEVDQRNGRLRRENADQAAVIEEQSERLTVYERILRRHGLLY